MSGRGRRIQRNCALLRVRSGADGAVTTVVSLPLQNVSLRTRAFTLSTQRYSRMRADRLASGVSVKAIAMRQRIGILGATGMVGQRYIQLLENHPWFEVSWLAASDRSSGKSSGEAGKGRLGTPPPGRIRKRTVSPAEPHSASGDAPKIIFASVDAAIAREMEPRFAAAGCAVLSNSSAFRMAANVPLVIPEVNAEHLHLIEEQPTRKDSGGDRVTNQNCSTIGLVLALKPIEGG